MIDSLRNLRRAMQSAAEKSRETDRGFDSPVGKLSRFLWPYHERWLLAVVGGLCALDYASTYAALELSRKPNVQEAGPLAGWALKTGGFPFLLLVDVLAAGALSLIAVAARYLYGRAGLTGYGRAAFVFALAAYVVRTAIAVVGNLVVGFM